MIAFLTCCLLPTFQKLGDADFPMPTPSQRHDEKVAAVRSHNYDLLMIGDSITHSVGEMGGVHEPLKAVWATHFAPRNAINLGYSGYRTENILWHMQNGELDSKNDPKVAVLLIGTNNTDDTNYKTVHTAEEIFRGTKAIVDTIRQKHPTTKILVLRIFPRGGAKEVTEYFHRYTNSARCVSTCEEAGLMTKKLADGKHVFWLDINGVFFRKDGSMDTDRIPDLVHPSLAGAEAWASALEPTLAKLIGDKILKSPQTLALEQAPASVRELSGKRVMILGDSITQDGRYVSDMEYLLDRQYPLLDFNFYSVGLASETASGLTETGHPFPRPDIHERLGRALTAIKPEVVMACYGMNDGIYQSFDKGRFEAFQKGITSMVDQCRKAGAKVILITPPAFDSSQFAKLTRPGETWDYSQPYSNYNDEVLGKFAEWEMRARPGGATVVDLHSPMSKIVLEASMKNLPEPKFYNSGDGVHPNESGHMFMAQTILDCLNAVPLHGSQPAEIDGLRDLVFQARQTRSEGWLSFIGYTRGETVKTNDIVSTENRARDIQTQIDSIRRK